MQKTAIAISLSFAALSVAISQQCQTGISNLAANSEASSCLGVNQFTNLFLTNPNTSVITPVQNWLTAFCGAPDCSNATIAAVVTNVSTACATDLQSLEITSSAVQMIIPYITEFFGTAKEVLCLADTSKSEFCAVEIGQTIETATGHPLSLDEFYDAYDTILGGSSPVNETLFCTACTQGALSILNTNTQISSLLGVATTDISKTCGSAFAASTTLPANIVVGTGTAVPKGNSSDNKGNGAGTIAVAASSMAVVFGAVLMAFVA